MSEPILSFTDHAGHRIAALSYPQPAADRLPVVWIHGLTASVHFWEMAMYAEVSSHRNWYSLSLPLHYPSTYSGAFTPDTMDEELLGELVALSVNRLIPSGRFHLVGYSLGAFACLNYAAKHPGRVASIISVGGFMTGQARGLRGVLRFIATPVWWRKVLFHLTFWVMQRHVIFLKGATLLYARNWRKLLAYPRLNPTLEDIFPDVKRHSITAQRLLFRYMLELDLMDETDHLYTPVLAIAGDEDPVIPYHHQVDYAKRLPNGQLLSLPGVGHVSFAEAPDAFRRGVVDWLDSHDQPAVTSS